MSSRWNRREFLVTSSLALAAGAFRSVPLLGQAPPQGTFRELRSNVGIFIGRGGTIGWHITPDALVVVDSQFPDTAQVCLDGLRERSTRTIDALINTHHHGDHTAGNTVFKPSARMIVAHARVPELQRRQAEEAGNAADQAYPDTTFTDTWQQSFGNETVRVTHYGPAHTGGDSIILFENANVVHMGDLMFHHRHPRVDRPGGASIRGWIEVLEQTVADHDDDTLYIFGHAKDGMDVTGGKNDLLFFRDYFTAVLEHVQNGVSAGRTREQVTSLEALPGFEDFMGVPPRLTLEVVLGDAYDELT